MACYGFGDLLSRAYMYRGAKDLHGGCRVHFLMTRGSQDSFDTYRNLSSILTAAIIRLEVEGLRFGILELRDTLNPKTLIFRIFRLSRGVHSLGVLGLAWGCWQ